MILTNTRDPGVARNEPAPQRWLYRSQILAEILIEISSRPPGLIRVGLTAGIFSCPDGFEQFVT